MRVNDTSEHEVAELRIANIGVGATLDELEEWAEEQSMSERRAGYDAQMRKELVIAATHVGREWAFMQAVARIREMREAILTDQRDS